MAGGGVHWSHAVPLGLHDGTKHTPFEVSCGASLRNDKRVGRSPLDMARTRLGSITYSQS